MSNGSFSHFAHFNVFFSYAELVLSWFCASPLQPANACSLSLLFFRRLDSPFLSLSLCIPRINRSPPRSSKIFKLDSAGEGREEKGARFGRRRGRRRDEAQSPSGRGRRRRRRRRRRRSHLPSFSHSTPVRPFLIGKFLLSAGDRPGFLFCLHMMVSRGV